MKMQGILLAASFSLLAACSSPAPGAAGPTLAASEVSSEADAKPARDPGLLWWQGAEPLCAQGELKRRTLSWGGVFWCATKGVRTDQSLQNDFGKLARCLQESVSAFQEEPEPDKLGAFLARAHEAGLNPVLCDAVRRDGEVRTYHGRRVMMERRVESRESNEIVVRYRFGCEDCMVASETTAKVAAKQVEEVSP